MLDLIWCRPVSGGSMNPARTIGPAMASNDYRAIWVYIIGPVCGTLLGAWSYNFIRVTDQPVQAIAPGQSFSFKLRRMKSNDDEEQGVNKDPLNDRCSFSNYEAWLSDPTHIWAGTCPDMASI
ncbi:Aquaporin [Datura stramonium]|uniref:Aquaporin n=1 Tax=Datura stramonium TaxID=4076 RepID=A0ABS8S4R2_DATST|nr:Aquaporin [Datura stramonium]